MGLFDHLFKTKAPTGGEKVGEHAAEGNAVKPADGAPKTPLPQKEKADPSAFLHPKSFVPRGAPGLTPVPRPPASGISGKSVERRPLPSVSPPAADEIVLTLGDVLSRIPAPYLTFGTHDARRELRFKINDLSSDIARGRAAVPLSRIARLVPDIFTREISREEDMEIRLPLQKLVEQIGLLRSQPKTSVVEKIARPITAAELSPAATPVVSLEATKAAPADTPAVSVPIAQTPVLESLAPAEELSPQTPPISLSELVVTPKSVELKPSVEPGPAAAPVVLGPSTAETSASTPIPPPELVTFEEKFAAGLARPAPEPEPEPARPIPSMLPATSAAPTESQKIIIDWGTVLSSKKEEGTHETPKPGRQDGVAQATRLESAGEGPKPSPLESADVDPDEEKIQLSLAAILRQCPREILVGELPQVDDSVRITLPFAPIDRQLVKGHVEVSALRFIVALPEAYQQYFVAKVGVKVPIPLEEVFQNLPAPKHEIIPQPPIPPPVVLAPAATASGPAPEVMPIAEKPEQPPHAATPVAEPVRPAPIAAEANAAEPPLPPIEPPPPSVAAPAEAPQTEPPASAAAAEETQSAMVTPEASTAPVGPSPELPLPVIPPIIDAPEAATAEKAAQPPLPATAEIAPGEAESSSVTAVAPAMPPMDAPGAAAPTVGAEPPINLASASQETPPHVLSAEPPLPQSITSAEVNALPSDDAPRLKLQPPIFRPHFVPPPPVFGFTPPAAPETELAIKPEPPSVPAGLSEVAAPGAPEARAEAASAVEPPVSKEEPVSLSTPPAAAAREEMPTAAAVATEPAEEKPTPAADAGPSAEAIALAGEHAAPDIAHFSCEPVPFADLAETLAHETTYAPDLAEVVHVDLPVAAPAEAKGPAEPSVVASELPTPVESAKVAELAEAEEHRPVPIVEGLAAAAVAATMAEHVPLDFREAVVPVEEPKAHEEIAFAPAEKIEEEPAASVESAEASGAASVAQTPAVLTPEPPVAAVPPPPPHPLFSLPKVPNEPAHVEVLPPPSLPLRRFDQDVVQALFMTEETLDLPKISRLAAALPGVYACVIATRDQACTGGNLPDGFDLAALLGLAPRVGEAAGRMPIGQLKHFTLYGDAYSVSFFERNGLSLCAVHRPRSFVPGVREKLVALADELSR